MYTEALEREQAVRTALAAPDATPAILPEIHAVVTAYESVVKHYRASGYSDNALWQGGRLSLDAFARFGRRQDKDAGVRLLRQLAAVYITSRLAKQVPEQLARLDLPAGSEDPALRTPRVVPAGSEDPARQALRAVPVRIATLKDIRRTVLPDAVRVTIELDGEVLFHEERISDPARVFLDLPATRPVPALADQTLRFDGDADIVRQIRIGRHPNNMTRVVLEASGITSYSVYPLYSPYRLVIDCVRSKTAATPTRSLPEAIDALVPPKIVELSPIAPIGPTTTPTRNVGGGFSIARQLGLSVSRIVIDAGHGGHDTGARGKGVTEAELVLDVALRLEKLLLKVQGVEVILTRRTDEFIPLQERTAIANREGADLFLSIHANASENAQARGIETYFLNFANNLSAASVAARENAASGQTMGALPDFVKAIALNNKLDESRDFATQVQRAMIERLRGANKAIRDLGVKQAPFVVLIGAAMPSVLAEISFVTNTQEAKLLKGNAYRQRIAEALLNAIRKYQTSLRKMTTVAHQ